MKARTLLLLLALAWATPSWSYNDSITHPDLTRSAFDASQLTTDPNLLKDLVLIPLSADPGFPFEGEYWRPRGIIAWGAFLEDAGERPVNHFFDPVNNRPLSVPYPKTRPSPTWALEDTEEFPEQGNSLRDARDSMYLALTLPGPGILRDAFWSATFESLGHVLHHIQDMAQPQHVRDDVHLDKYPWLIGFYDPSRYEDYTQERRTRVRELAASAQAVFPGAPELKKPRDFWINTTQSGIAQFTNQNFLSKRTNFAMFFGRPITPKYPLPVAGASKDYTIDSLYAGQNQPVPEHIAALCNDPTIDCTVTMYASQPAGFPSQLVTKASTLSIFDQDLEARGLTVSYSDGYPTPNYQVSQLFSLNHFNFDEMQEKLIPKAVAYSAGLINYFFRGKLQVSPPSIGAYAVADHSAGQGFRTVKAKVKNIMLGEDMSNGRVVAVAKFHRNECYQSDLTGEFTQDASGNLIDPPCAAGQQYRTDEEFAVTSDDQSLALKSDQEQELTFTFSTPIPFDATDLYLQVVFRGTLGAEEHSVAVGTVDISEPTFFSLLNGTDVFALPDGSPRGQFFYYKDIIAPANIVRFPYSIVDANGNRVYDSPPDVDVIGGDIHYWISLAGAQVAEIPALPEGRFSRLAFLMAPSGLTIGVRAEGAGFIVNSSYPEPAKTSQYNWDDGIYYVSPVLKLRSQTYHWDSVTYYRYYGSANPALETMPPSGADKRFEPMPVIVAQSLDGNAFAEAPLEQQPDEGAKGVGSVGVNSPPTGPRKVLKRPAAASADGSSVREAWRRGQKERACCLRE